MGAVPDDSFYQSFSSEVRGALAAKLQLAYDEVAERHDTRIGFNENTFAISVYHVTAYQISLVETEFGRLVRVESRNPKFRFRVGEYVIACHRVGRAMGDNIGYSFPPSESAAAEMVPSTYPGQLALPFSNIDPDIGLQRSIVLAHFGNPMEGFIKAYLCFPTEALNGQIVAWGFVDPLLESMAPAEIKTPPTPGGLPPVEPVGEYQLRMKRRKGTSARTE